MHPEIHKTMIALCMSMFEIAAISGSIFGGN
jgi:sugar phosphate permease